VALFKFLGFETRRLTENNKLAYVYTGKVGKDGDLHPLMQMAYDEIKTNLAKLKQGQYSPFTVSELP
jgi:hypothetical protein